MQHFCSLVGTGVLWENVGHGPGPEETGRGRSEVSAAGPQGRTEGPGSSAATTAGARPPFWAQGHRATGENSVAVATHATGGLSKACLAPGHPRLEVKERARRPLGTMVQAGWCWDRVGTCRRWGGRFDIIDTQDSTMIDIHDVFKVIMNYPLAFENQVNWGSWC